MSTTREQNEEGASCPAHHPLLELLTRRLWFQIGDSWVSDCPLSLETLSFIHEPRGSSRHPDLSASVGMPDPARHQPGPSWDTRFCSLCSSLMYSFPSLTIFFFPPPLAFHLILQPAAPHGTGMTGWDGPSNSASTEKDRRKKGTWPDQPDRLSDKGNEPGYRATAIIADLPTQNICLWQTSHPVFWEHQQKAVFPPPLLSHLFFCLVFVFFGKVRKSGCHPQFRIQQQN